MHHIFFSVMLLLKDEILTGVLSTWYQVLALSGLRENKHICCFNCFTAALLECHEIGSPLESDLLSSVAAAYFCTSKFNSTRAQVKEFNICAVKKIEKPLAGFGPDQLAESQTVGSPAQSGEFRAGTFPIKRWILERSEWDGTAWLCQLASRLHASSWHCLVC